MSDFSILSTDIVHQILVSVPNFKSLLSLLLTSKLFNDVFEAHPHGIVRDVAHNQVGPALPQALRLVRCETAGYRFKDVADLPAEDDIMKQPITRAEARVLAQNAYVAYTLEDVFSRRYISISFAHDGRPLRRNTVDTKTGHLQFLSSPSRNQLSFKLHYIGCGCIHPFMVCTFLPTMNTTRIPTQMKTRTSAKRLA